jgi:hypothetical protein
MRRASSPFALSPSLFTSYSLHHSQLLLEIDVGERRAGATRIELIPEFVAELVKAHVDAIYVT